VTLIRSSGAEGVTYQSVMMTPPKGSAETSGREDSVSRVAGAKQDRQNTHRLDLTLKLTGAAS